MMRNIVSLIFLFSLIFIIGSCSEPVKQDSEPSQGTMIDPASIREPTPEEEKRIQITINFDGRWRKQTTGSRAVIEIKGKTGKIIGKNGAEIPIIVKYINERTVKILEPEYNPKYLENWLPEPIASQVYLNQMLKKTYSILRIIDDDTLKGTSFAWQVFHDKGVVQRIDSLVSPEEWKRIKGK